MKQIGDALSVRINPSAGVDVGRTRRGRNRMAGTDRDDVAARKAAAMHCARGGLTQDV
jgi:hypothetical protein